MVRFALNHKGVLPYGWAPRILVQCGVPYVEIWDVFHEMYESQVLRTLINYKKNFNHFLNSGSTFQWPGQCPGHFLRYRRSSLGLAGRSSKTTILSWTRGVPCGENRPRDRPISEWVGWRCETCWIESSLRECKTPIAAELVVHIFYVSYEDIIIRLALALGWIECDNSDCARLQQLTARLY